VRVRHELLRREQRLGRIVVERDPFETEEEQVVLDVGAAVAPDRR